MTLDVVETGSKIKVAPKESPWLRLLAADACHLKEVRITHMSPLSSLSSADAIANIS